MLNRWKEGTVSIPRFISDGFLFAANGYTQIAVKIKMNPDGSEPTLVWKNADITPHVGGMVLIGNYIYGSTHDTNSKGKMDLC